VEPAPHSILVNTGGGNGTTDTKDDGCLFGCGRISFELEETRQSSQRVPSLFLHGIAVPLCRTSLNISRYPANITRPNDPAGTFRPSLANQLRWPNNSLLPTQLLEKATHSVLRDKNIAFPALSYGPDSGDPRLRKNLASWLTSFYQPAEAIAEDRICITGGASQNLACLLQVYTDPVFTRNVWIVAPAYMLSFRIFEDAGFHGTLRAVPEDDQGIDIEYLRREIKMSEDKAKADGNNEPVCAARISRTISQPMQHIRIIHEHTTCTICAKLTYKSDIQIYTIPTVVQDLQTHHLRSTDLLKPQLQNHESSKATRASPPRKGV
jgi:hypothetical protein